MFVGELSYLNGYEYLDIAARVKEKDKQVVSALGMFDFFSDQVLNRKLVFTFISL